MRLFLRNLAVVILAWCVTFVTIVAGGFILATSGMSGELAEESIHSGTSGPEVAKRRMEADPTYGRKLLDDMTAKANLMNRVYLPGLAILLGVILAVGTSGWKGLPALAGLALFANFTLSTNLRMGILQCLVGFGTWALISWKRRKVA